MRTRLVAAAALVFTTIFGFMLSTCQSSCWTELKNSHRLKRLNLKSHIRLTELSDDAEFRQVLAPLLIERPAGSPGNKIVRTYIADYMRNLGWTIFEDSFVDSTPVGNVNFTNIVATHNPGLRRQLVLACHLDSKPMPHYASGAPFIGATDSAVPCAIMLHLARLLNASLWHGNSGEGEDVSLQLIFFDGEEAYGEWSRTDSTYGSRHLAALWESSLHPLDRNQHILDGIDVLILLDLIGAPRPRFPNYFRKTTKLFQSLGSIESYLRARNLLSQTTESFFQISHFFGGTEDDHIPFMERGVSILHLIPSPFPDVWHTEGDNEAALDFATINEISVILRVLVSQYLHLMA